MRSLIRSCSVLLSWTVRFYHTVSIDPHDDRPLVFTYNREAGDFEALPRLHSFDRYDPRGEGSRARPDHLWKGPIWCERRHQSSKVVQRTEGGDQDGWRCKRASPIVRPLLTIVAQYYTRAWSTPLGSKVQAFYTTTTKRVHDIHEEAMRLAGWNKSGVVEPSADAEASTKAA